MYYYETVALLVLGFVQGRVLGSCYVLLWMTWYSYGTNYCHVMERSIHECKYQQNTSHFEKVCKRWHNRLRMSVSHFDDGNVLHWKMCLRLWPLFISPLTVKLEGKIGFSHCGQNCPENTWENQSSGGWCKSASMASQHSYWRDVSIRSGIMTCFEQLKRY